MQPYVQPPFLTRSRVRRLRTAGMTGVALGATVVLWGPVTPAPARLQYAA
jgi:hypothetical protein